MRSISKALAGGLGAALAKLVTQGVHHYAPDIDSQSLEFVIYTLLTGFTVYVAPSNTPTT